jgi:hypothetical protein
MRMRHAKPDKVSFVSFGSEHQFTADTTTVQRRPMTVAAHHLRQPRPAQYWNLAIVEWEFARPVDMASSVASEHRETFKLMSSA